MSTMHDFNLDDKYIRQVRGWPYWITYDGEVYNQHGKQLKLHKDAGGYLRVGLCKNGKKKTFRVHNLVLEAFVGPKPEGMETRHLDGNRKNNHISNLKYGTPSENTQDTVKHGMHPQASKTHCPKGHKYTPENTHIKTGRAKSGIIWKSRDCRQCNKIPTKQKQIQRANKLVQQIREIRQQLGA